MSNDDDEKQEEENVSTSLRKEMQIKQRGVF
jgi:hypothetical protein